MANIQEARRNIEQFAKRNTGRLLIGSALVVGGIAIGGYEGIVRSGKDVPSIVKSLTDASDPYKACEAIPEGRNSTACVKLINTTFHDNGF